MAQKKIKGRIIRIIDPTTVVINLGSDDGIVSSSRFYVLGEPEQVVDPVSNELLGTVNVTKIVLKTNQVFERFTIAVSKWTESKMKNNLTAFMTGFEYETLTYGTELNVEKGEIKPWRSKTEIPVKIGDEVEVEVDVADEPDGAEAAAE